MDDRFAAAPGVGNGGGSAGGGAGGADVVSGAAMAARYDGVVTLCFPGGAHIERWVAFLRQMKLTACVILPRWHGPAMAAVAQGRLAEWHLGPARAIFSSPRGQSVPLWKMVATVADFGRDAAVQGTGT